MKLEQFIPNKIQDPKPIQGWIENKTWEKVNHKRKKDELTWDELLDALCKFYIQKK